METTNYSLNLNSEDLKKWLSRMNEARLTQEAWRSISPEDIQEATNVSKTSRDKVISVFDRAGKPLGSTLKKEFPISIETGVKNIWNYTPNAKSNETGGVYNNFQSGDMQVNDTKRYINYADNAINYYQSNIVANNKSVDFWNTTANEWGNRANEYVQSNLQSFQPGWDLVSAWKAQWQPISNEEYGIVGTGNLTKEEQDTIAKFNSVNSEANKYWKENSNAYTQKIRYEEYLKRDIRALSDNRDYRSELGMQLTQDERVRYRYLMQDVDFGKKIQESQKSFGEIFGKTYTQESVQQNYYNAMDSLWGLMNGMQSGKILTEKDFKSSLQIVGAGLSDEEKLIFLWMVGANLDKLTYNWDKAKSGSFSSVKPFESMQALVKAYQYWETIPTWVCSSIHVAVATIAETWGIPAGTLTVSNKWIWHVVALMDINGKKVLSDYGKTYSANRVEDLFDAYAKTNQWVVLRNYITNSSGKIIGHVETPLTQAFRKEVLSENQLSNILSNGELSQDGGRVMLYNNTKGLRWQYTLNNWVYFWGKYSEAKLISWVDAKTLSATVWKKWNDIDLWNGWKWMAFWELHGSQSEISFDGNQSAIKSTTLWIQSWMRWEKVYADGSNIYAWLWVRSIWQWSRPKNSKYNDIPIVWTGTSGESGMNIVLGGNYQVRDTTRIWWEIWVQSEKWINVQSIGASDLNPLVGGQYTTQTMKVWVEEKIGSGYVNLTWGIKKWPLSEEKTLGIGYSWENIWAKVEQVKINPTHIFGPTAQNIIRANIEWNLGKWNDGKWFAWIEKWWITGTRAQAGVKWTF
jgi:hypothetical protein